MKLGVIISLDVTTYKVGDLTTQGMVTPTVMTETAFAQDGRLFVSQKTALRSIGTKQSGSSISGCQVVAEHGK